MRRLHRVNYWVALIVMIGFITSCAAAVYGHKRRGELAMQRGDFEKAKQSYLRVLEIEGGKHDTYFQLGECSRRLGDWNDACNYYAKALAINPTLATYERLGDCHHRQGNPAKEKEIWKAVIVINGKHAKANKGLADIYFDEGEYKKAIEKYKTALEAKPDNHGARASLGAAYVAIGRFESAIDALQPVIASDPKNILARNNLGVAFLGAGRNEDALREFTVVTETSPTYMDGWINLAATHCRLGDILKGIESLERAKENGFNDWERIEKDGDFARLILHERYLQLTGVATEPKGVTEPETYSRPIEPEKEAENASENKSKTTPSGETTDE